MRSIKDVAWRKRSLKRLFKLRSSYSQRLFFFKVALAPVHVLGASLVFIGICGLSNKLNRKIEKLDFIVNRIEKDIYEINARIPWDGIVRTPWGRQHWSRYARGREALASRKRKFYMRGKTGKVFKRRRKKVQS